MNKSNQSNPIKRTFVVDGMSCVSCENRIERAVNKIQGIISVKANYNKSKLYVTYKSNSNIQKQIKAAVEKAGYKLGNDVTDGNTSEPKSKEKTFQAIGILLIIISLYVIIQNTIGFNFFPNITQSMGYGVLFVVGIMTSLHCVAMCGGINISQCASYKVSKGSSIKPSILYNAGRIVSYTIIGGIVGALGSAISLTGQLKGLVAVLAGIFMIIMGINMLNIFKILRKLTIRMPKLFANKIHSNNGKYGPFVVGMINGLMPCGPLQSMQIYALGTGNALSGAVSMLVFSLGTVPLMFGVGVLSTVLNKKFTSQMMKVSAALVIVLGVVMANRGLALSGVQLNTRESKQVNQIVIEGSDKSQTERFIEYWSKGNNIKETDIKAIKNGDVQEVEIDLKSGSYENIKVKKGIPVKFIINATKENLNGCNGTVIIPKYNIEKKLNVGRNIIEFTPTEEGNITYSCWMGMIRNNIEVIK